MEKYAPDTIFEKHRSVERKDKALSLFHPELQQYVISEEKVVYFNYPLHKIPQHLKAVQLEKQPTLNGVLSE